MIIRGGKIYLLEINTIPGLTPTSLLPQEAAAAGISYSQLLDKIIQLALKK
jgi:D-alanine-D-alanine ligase